MRLLERLGGGPAAGVAFVLDLTAAATEVDDTLDVFVQTKLDGTNWVDVAHFTQVVGNGGATKRHFLKVLPEGNQGGFEGASVLPAGTVRNLFGIDWRATWTIVDAGSANASFTFSVTAIPQ